MCESCFSENHQGNDTENIVGKVPIRGKSLGAKRRKGHPEQVAVMNQPWRKGEGKKMEAIRRGGVDTGQTGQQTKGDEFFHDYTKFA